ncbi:hypothetical protein ACHAXS_011553 [Conticribra weissflogii]
MASRWETRLRVDNSDWRSVNVDCRVVEFSDGGCFCVMRRKMNGNESEGPFERCAQVR